MKILVTGGSGFIGTRLVGELLKDGHQVTIFDKNNSSQYPELVVDGNVCDKEALIKAAAGNDAIYHLAAQHADNVHPESLYYDVNVGGAKNTVCAANNASIKKIIFTSSVAVYPLNAGMPDEESLIAPFNKYGQSKYAAEQVFSNWVSEDSSRSLVTIRPCAIFGEENRGNVYNMLLQIYKKQFFMVGNGKNKKSVGYVGNIARFLTFCLDLDYGHHIYNYSDKPDLSTNELVKIARNAFGRNGNGGLQIPYGIGLFTGFAFDVLSRISGKSFPISSVRIRKFCADTTISTTRLSETGFMPPYSLKDALEKTIKSEFHIENK